MWLLPLIRFEEFYTWDGAPYILFFFKVRFLFFARKKKPLHSKIHNAVRSCSTILAPVQLDSLVKAAVSVGNELSFIG